MVKVYQDLDGFCYCVTENLQQVPEAHVFLSEARISFQENWQIDCDGGIKQGLHHHIFYSKNNPSFS